MVHHVPEGYHAVTPYLAVNGAAKALEFYKKAFGATEVMRMQEPSGKIVHAEIKIGDSHIMLADEFPDIEFQSPTSVGGASALLMIYVENADAVFKQALECGAQQTRALQDQFYGDRSGTLRDPFGHVWTVATHVEDVPPDEMERRAQEYAQKQNA